MRILVVVQTHRFCTFEISSSRLQPLPIKDGEFYLTLDELESLGEIFKEFANVKNLKDFDFDIINATGVTDCIQVLVSSVFPCKSFQVRSIDAVLPELLLKRNAMNGESVKLVSFDNKKYEVSVDSSNIWNVVPSDKEGETLNEADLASLYTEGFSLNGAKIAELEEQIALLKNENEKQKKEIADKDLVISNFVQKQKEEEEKKQKKIQEENLKKQNKEKLKLKRQEIRLTQAMVDAMNLKSQPIVYLQKDKARIREYDPIIQNSLNCLATSGEDVIRPDLSNLADKAHVVLANTDGVFYRGCNWISQRKVKGALGLGGGFYSRILLDGGSGLSTSRPWHAGDLVGIIADPKDDEAEIRKYMENVMRKEAMKGRV
jgi:hypothetical protein